ncbi:hypothetical protein AVEN_70582-1 [Araneus ventricosus]|uniref:Tc1-like transposase DDE domain-containing protein n=1 Tax=Araneus ventricosus TaxID=182803 RepID=A0A4Y2CG22_ARAVE|nr:hypothetical protein AVEN_70582-1 [Araneus ventricosus]
MRLWSPLLAFSEVKIGLDFTFIGDSVRPHKAHLVDKYIDNENIRHIDWSTRSPDRYPILNVWDALVRAPETLFLSLRPIQNLKTALLMN